MKIQNSRTKYFFNCLVRRFICSLCVLTVLGTLMMPAYGQASVKMQREESLTQPENPSMILVPNGMAVVTGTGSDGPTVRVVDISQFGGLWSTPSNRAPAYIGSSAQMPLMRSWNTTDFTFTGGPQAMRTLAVSGDGTKIYVGASGYTGSDKSPNIYRIGPSNTAPQLLCWLPSYTANTANRKGVAGLDLDEIHDQIFASNFADGNIYRQDATTGAYRSQFDPLTPSISGSVNLPPVGERITAVAYHKIENRLYYGVWGYDTATGTGLNTVRSIGLTVAGAFDPPTDREEFVLTGSVAPALDIEFNDAGNKMLIAEENLNESANPNLVTLGAHQARGLEYTGGTGTWTRDPTLYGSGSLKYNIGIFSGTNSRGGAAWAYSNINIFNGAISGNESFVMFTGDALRLDTASVYGLQYLPSSGGSAGTGGTSNSLIADLDYDVVSQDKFVYGDVDIRRSAATTSANADVSGRVTRADGSGISKATVSITNSLGESRTAVTNPFGYYRFDALSTGETYFLDARVKGYQFNTRVMTLIDNATGIDFIALE